MGTTSSYEPLVSTQKQGEGDVGSLFVNHRLPSSSLNSNTTIQKAHRIIPRVASTDLLTYLPLEWATQKTEINVVPRLIFQCLCHFLIGRELPVSVSSLVCFQHSTSCAPAPLFDRGFDNVDWCEILNKIHMCYIKLTGYKKYTKRTQKVDTKRFEIFEILNHSIPRGLLHADQMSPTKASDHGKPASC